MSLYKTKEKIAAEPARPEQMFALASAVVCLAKDQGRKKASSRAERAHILLPKRVELYSGQDDEYMHITRRFIGRIGRIGYRRWSMRVVEPYWVNTEEESSSYRSTYAFEWTHEDVVTATKKITVDSSSYDCGYGFQPEMIDASMFEPDFLNAELKNANMSAADCDLLLDEVRDFGSLSIQAVQYSH
jgi:hypothetical protein